MMEDLILDLETYLNNEVHTRCEYDIYSALMDFNAEINAKYKEIKKKHNEELKDVAIQSEHEFWKQLKFHFEPL